MLNVAHAPNQPDLHGLQCLARLRMVVLALASLQRWSPVGSDVHGDGDISLIAQCLPMRLLGYILLP